MDGFIPLALASQWAQEVRLGCACFPVQTRGPAVMAQSAATLSLAAPGRFVMGIGASSVPIVEWWNGIPYGKPYAAVRDMLRFLKRALAGEVIDEAFESYRIRRFKLGPTPEPPPPVLVAGLRPGMIELGAREGDGVILNMIAPEDLATVLPLVRKHGDAKEVAMRITLCPTDDYERAMAVAKRWALQYLTVDTYRSQQEWLGRGDLIAQANACWAAGDRKGALAALPDEAVQTGWFVGTADACRARIRAYEDAGLDTIILSFLEDVNDPWQVARELAPPAGGGEAA